VIDDPHAPIFYFRGKPMEHKGRILLIVQTDIEPEMEEEFNRWYEEEHIPRLLNVPGVIMARRGINTGNGQKYIAIYEHEDLDVQYTSAYKNAIETEWTKKIRPYLRNFERNVYKAI
jgi:cyclophilin family peptidyl-prolyl cis-trans isomerase